MKLQHGTLISNGKLFIPNICFSEYNDNINLLQLVLIQNGYILDKKSYDLLSLYKDFNKIANDIIDDIKEFTLENFIANDLRVKPFKIIIE